MVQKLKQEQIENIQIDYGIVIANYGELNAKRIGPTRGGAEFSATKNIRDIEYDGQLGKAMGLQVIDEINASLTFSIMDTSLETLGLLMPHADFVEEDNGGTITNVVKNTQGGVIPESKYLKNITMFAKLVGGGYKMITLFNALNEGDFVLSSAPKAEGEIPIEVYAHWNPETMEDLYRIEDIAAIDPFSAGE